MSLYRHVPFGGLRSDDCCAACGAAGQMPIVAQRWVLTSPSYRVISRKCRACGAIAKTFEISKELFARLARSEFWMTETKAFAKRRAA